MAWTGGKSYAGKETLEGKVVIITGANSGIGKETTLALAKRKAKVIMACRNMNKCETARREIVLATKNKYVYCRECNLESQKSIREFVDLFKKEESKLHILINNAGVMHCPKSYTQEGIEMHMGVNYMGHFLLTNLLLDVLKASAPSRIINVASVAYKQGKINISDLNNTEKYDAREAFAQSKLALIMFTRELARKLTGTGVTVNAVHPGIAHTEINRNLSFHNSYFSALFLKPLTWPFIKSAKQAAETIINLALNPDLNSTSGCYFSNGKLAEITDEAKNDSLAKWLWLTSEKWTKLNSS
ncbi:retinol dehydrogenase 13-like isoform X2 [Orussus abietinus]|uniref:retinol dehydrogenase 13-like isoform X2 n=1 Tax=Orussus abietinus TaxID=222816 RepID=UPI0006250EAD|nr:retinol dehydrogenase 13-like isoform X2 [Orussus abietinus]